MCVMQMLIAMVRLMSDDGDGDVGGDGGDGDESLGLGSWWQPHVCLNTHYNLTKLKHNPLVLMMIPMVLIVTCLYLVPG